MAEMGGAGGQYPDFPAAATHGGQYIQYNIFGNMFEITNKYRPPIMPIGRGAYGIVCSVMNTETNEMVAVKKIANAFDNYMDAKRTLREIKLLRHLDHENVIALKDVIPPPLRREFTDVYMTTELMDTDLHQIIRSNQGLSEEHCQYFLYQLLRGLKYIHSAGIIHRDLKPSNLLLNANCDLKICDFGLARLNTENEFMTEYVVTRWYRAPELLLNSSEYTSAIDVWSVGCIFMELMNRKPLFAGRDHVHQMHLLIELLGTPTDSDLDFTRNEDARRYIRQLPQHPRQNLAKIFSHVNPLAMDLVDKMLTINPTKRITGTAGTRFTIATTGANQFDNPKHQGIFFNWYIFTMYTANIISATAIVYVEENVSWAWGFSLCAIANVLGLVVFLCGTRFYRFVKQHSSPFKSLTCVIVAAISKRKMTLSLESEDYYHDLHADSINTAAKAPTDFLRFLNRAALRTRGETTPDGSRANPWRLCTVEQVEDLKSLIKIFPLWSSGLILSIPIAIQLSFIIFQARTMDSHLGPRLKTPAASMQIFILTSTCITILILDRLLFPLWEKLAQRPLTPLLRVGIGHFFTILSMAISASVESKRLKLEKSENPQNQVDVVISMSVFWLAPQLAIVGIAEGFHFAGQVALYYKEFPESMKSISTAAVAMSIGGAFYSSNLVIDLVRKLTGWLPDDINNGRLDNVYWVCCILGALNLVYYLVCASLYKYKR